MTDQDIKRLLAGFLFLALVVGSLTFTFSVLFGSNNSSANSSASAQNQNGSQDYAMSNASDGGNAQIENPSDVPTLPILPSVAGANGTTTSIPFDPTNFTDVLAANLGQQVNEANPNGPTTDVLGNPAVTIPSTAQDVANLSVSNDQFAYVPPPIDESRVKVNSKYNAQDIVNYFNQVSAIMSNSLTGSNGIEGIAAQLQQDQTNATTSSDGSGDDTGAADLNDPILINGMNALNLLTSEVQDQIYNITVPAPALAYHQELLGFLEFEKTLSSTDFQTDPLKSLVALQDGGSIIQTKLQQMQADITSAEHPLSLNPSASWQDLSQNFLAIPVAHAQFDDVVQDFLTENNTLAISADDNLIQSAIDEYVYFEYPAYENAQKPAIFGTAANTLLQAGNSTWQKIEIVLLAVLKTQLIARLEQSLISWVQNGGTPQFVPNWGQFFENIANQAGGAVIGVLEPQLCKSFGPLLKIAFLPVTNPNTTPVTCSLTQIISNVENFYNSFQNGSWIAYGAALQPANNLFGAMIQTNDLVTQAEIAASGQSLQQAQASNGFLSTKQCVSSNTETVPYSSLASVQQNPLYDGIASCSQGGLGGATVPGGQVAGNPNFTSSDTCTVYICDPNGYQITTPGSYIANLLPQINSQSVVGQIVNAQDITNLVNALINAAVSRLIRVGTQGLAGLLSSYSGSTPTSQISASTTDPCAGLTGADLSSCEGITTVPGGADPGSQSDLEQLATSDAQTLQDNITADNQWLSAASTTITDLQSASVVCATSTFPTEAQTTVSLIQALAPTVNDDLTTATTTLATVQTILSQIQSATSTAALAPLSDQLDGLDGQQIINNLDAAQTRVSNLTTIDTEAQAAIGGDCSETLDSP